MARFVSTTPGWGKPGDLKRTDQAIRRWIKAQLTQGLGGGTPASIGFVLTQSNPASFGAQMATDAPEVIYSLGNLYYSGGVRVLQATGRGNPAKRFRRTDQHHLCHRRRNGVLTASGAAAMTLTLERIAAALNAGLSGSHSRGRLT